MEYRQSYSWLAVGQYKGWIGSEDGGHGEASNIVLSGFVTYPADVLTLDLFRVVEGSGEALTD